MKTIKRRYKLKNKTIKGGNNEATLVVRRSNIYDDELVYNFFVRRIGIPSIFDFVGLQTSLVDEGLSYINRKNDRPFPKKPTDKKEPTDKKTANEIYRQTVEFGKEINHEAKKKVNQLIEQETTTEKEPIKRTTEIERLKSDNKGREPKHEKRLSKPTLKTNKDIDTNNP
jgi:Txe/YoeB family toxin of Txe-Axe toxin-antitoxin module